MFVFMWLSVLCVYSVKCFKNMPEQTRGVMKGRAGSERSFNLPESVVALY